MKEILVFLAGAVLFGVISATAVSPMDRFVGGLIQFTLIVATIVTIHILMDRDWNN
jgi:hypothetical protein